MTEQVLLLFDDAVARAFQPFTLTRPAGELLFGACLQRVRAQRVFGRPCRGHLAAAHLVDFDEPGAPAVLADPSALAAEASVRGEGSGWGAVPRAARGAAPPVWRSAEKSVDSRPHGSARAPRR